MIKKNIVLCRYLILVVFGLGATQAQQVHAMSGQECLAKALQEAKDSQTVGELEQHCGSDFPETSGAVADTYTDTTFSRTLDDVVLHDSSFSIQAHKPNYILPIAYNSRVNREPFVGFDGDIDSVEIKFQTSLKFLAVNNLFGSNGDLFVAYTNLSYWQAYNSDISSPFRETNHEPEVFLAFDTDWKLGPLTSTQVKFGAVHQSNGRSGTISRSWNRLYASVLFQVNDSLSFNLKPWWRVPESSKNDDNPDIHNYLGYGEFWVNYKARHNKFSMMMRNNLRKDNNRGAIQLDWIFPIKERVNVYVQYFNGYGESLIDYDESVNRFGIGFILTNWM